MASSARVVVSRTSEEDVRQRQVLLALDGQHWTTLMFGGSATREVAAGRHRLKADNTLFRKTLEFDLDPGQEARFVVASRKGPGSGVFLLLGAPFYYVDLRRE